MRKPLSHWNLREALTGKRVHTLDTLISLSLLVEQGDWQSIAIRRISDPKFRFACSSELSARDQARLG